jgi:hypothetical protein
MEVEMTTDSGSRERDAEKPDFSLPDVLDLRTRRITFEPPQHRNFVSALTEGEAVEFVITTDKPIPIRALGPVLYVGETPVGESAPLRKKNAYRFVALEPEALRSGAPVSLGWTGQPRRERRKTKFSYEG